MAIEYTYTYDTVEKVSLLTDDSTPPNTHENVITKIIWELKAQEEFNNEIIVVGQLNTFETNTEDLSNFNSFDSITSDDLEAWVNVPHNKPYVDQAKLEVSQSLASNIEMLKNSPQIVKIS